MLLCEASANPDVNSLCRLDFLFIIHESVFSQVLTFWWDRGNESYVGDSQEVEGGSQIRINIQNDSLGSEEDDTLYPDNHFFLRRLYLLCEQLRGRVGAVFHTD